MNDKHSDATSDIAAKAAPRPVTYHQASSRNRGIVDARERYEALTDRKMAVDTVRILRERGEFDAANPAHASLAEREPLSTGDWLEMMAAGEVLARYYQHPTMLDHAARAGASWEQIGDARGTSAAQARQDYREWARGQHDMWASTGVWAEEPAHRIGMTDEDYVAAMARSADSETYPGGIGDPEAIGIRPDREAGK
jgi:hypothetical protein